MVSQHKGVSTFIFLTSLIKYTTVQSQQLALPNEILAKASQRKIALKEFAAPYTDYLFSAGIENNIVISRSILNLARVQNAEKFFISTN